MGMSDDASRTQSSAPPSDDRRRTDRYEVIWSVDCMTDETFLYASITNISEMGIFVKTLEPLPIGTRLLLSFAPPGYEPFKLAGVVAWQNQLKLQADNPNPGMGVRFMDLGIQDRERLVEVIRTIAYLRGSN
ncbi:TIGR02266 family protein [Pendulispora albinea]